MPNSLIVNIRDPKQSNVAIGNASSLEVRWFARTGGNDWSSWWEFACPRAESEEERVDRYLHFPGATFAGVKVRNLAHPGDGASPRQVNLEFKLRDRELGIVTFLPSITGVIEEWQKWSAKFSVESQLYGGEYSAFGGQWVDVSKTRFIQKFSFDGTAITEVALRDRPDSGCAAEFCELSLPEFGNDDPGWHSICFEAFSTNRAQNLLNILNRTVRQVMSIGRPPELSADQSGGYPAWLAYLLANRSSLTVD